jgi:hypothetical protein
MDVSSTHASAADFLQAYLGQCDYARLLALPLRPPTREMLQRWPNARYFRAVSRRPLSYIGRLLGRSEIIVLVASDDAQSEVIIARRRLRWLPANVLVRRQFPHLATRGAAKSSLDAGPRPPQPRPA